MFQTVLNGIVAKKLRNARKGGGGFGEWWVAGFSREEAP